MKNRWLNEQAIVEIFQRSKTYAQVLTELNLTLNVTNYTTAKKYASKYNISVAHFEPHFSAAVRKSKQGLTPDDRVFVENSTYSRASLKKRLIRDRIIPYKCNDCGNEGEWNGKNLVLQLEHKNGINTDNRIENLCFLCPNCHTQTDTYAGKNMSNKKPPRLKQSVYFEKRRTEALERNRPLIQRVEESSIDFSKFGWCQHVAPLIGKPASKVVSWMKKYMAQFYEDKCYKTRRM